MPNLTDEWEASDRALILSAGGHTVEIPGPTNSTNQTSDTGDEPYDWLPSAAKVTEIQEWMTTFMGLSQADHEATTLTFDDGLGDALTALEITGSLAGAGGTLSGSLALGTDTALAISGSLAGAGGTLSGSLVLLSDTALTISGSLSGAGGALAGRLVLLSDTQLAISGALSGAGGSLAGALALVTIAPTALAISGSVAGAGGALTGALALISTDAPAALDTLIPPPAPRFPTIDVASRVDLLIPQYADSTNLQTLARELTDIVDKRIVAPLLIMERAMNPDESEGVLLDWLGQRVGLPRPYINLQTKNYLGLEGTMADVGLPLDQAPYITTQTRIENVEPISDVHYRLMLKGRARRLRGGADRETLEAVLNIVFGNGYLDESVTPMECVVSTSAGSPGRLILVVLFTQSAVFERVVPRPAGRAMTIRER